MTIRVYLVDDQELVRAGFRMLIDSQSDLSVVGEAGDGQEAVAALGRTEADVVLMDVRMPRMDGVEATGLIAGREGDFGAVGASEAVADDDAGWARRGERPLLEHGHDRGIGLVGDRGPPSQQQRYEHHGEVAHAHLPDETPETNLQSGRAPAKVGQPARHRVMSVSGKA